MMKLFHVLMLLLVAMLTSPAWSQTPERMASPPAARWVEPTRSIHPQKIQRKSIDRIRLQKAAPLPPAQTVLLEKSRVQRLAEQLENQRHGSRNAGF